MRNNLSKKRPKKKKILKKSHPVWKKKT